MRNSSKKVYPLKKVFNFKFITFVLVLLILILIFTFNLKLIKACYYLNVSGLFALKGNEKLSLEYLKLSFDSGVYSGGDYYQHHILTNNLDSLRRAYEISPSNFFYLTKLASASIENGKWFDSQKYFSGIKLARYLAKEGISFVYNRDDDISRKGLFYLSFARKISSDPRISYELGRAFCWRYNSFDKGNLLISAALSRDPKNPSYYGEIGSINKRKGNYSKALSYFVIANRIDPNNYWNFINIAEILRDEGYLDEALSFLGKAREIDPKIESAYYLAAGIYKKLDKLDNAYNEYQKIIEIDPLSYSPRYNFGVFLYSVGEYEKSLTQLTMAIILKNDHLWSYYYRSLVYEKLSKFNEALVDMKKVASYAPENDSFLRRLKDLESKVNETSNNKTESH
jgi:tetratricopeptide (TPR) repeat protein